MILKSVVLENFRNYHFLELRLNNNINMLIGENAQGKTNFIEAIYYLSTGRTFRNNKDGEIINWQKDYFRIKGIIAKENINREITIDIYYDRKGTKQIKINGVKYKKLADLFGYLQVVVFSPDDLSIIKGSPAERRKYIDLEICQLVAGYYNNIINYNKVLVQRNNLLKEIRDHNCSAETLEVWDDQFIKFGSTMIKNRLDFLKKVVPWARKIQQEITGGKEELEIKYSSLIVDNPQMELEAIEKKFKTLLEKNKKQEINKAFSIFGPHRDDIIFYINNNDLKTFGSQGQQRTGILSLKIAELKLFNYNNQEYPILLLDDVMSELDDLRREFLINIIRNNKIQTFISGANLKIIEEGISNQEIYQVNCGTIVSSKEE
ncbi:MAG: DNA replication/repair protein RecF [Peptococcaceae bacterium]